MSCHERAGPKPLSVLTQTDATRHYRLFMFDHATMKYRWRAAGFHLLISLVVAFFAGALVFLLWYPSEFREWAGGRELFLLLISVDVALGPLLTFAVFHLQKGWTVLRRDLAVIAFCQLLALGYGMYTVFWARPVALVYEKDRFRVITAVQVQIDELPKAPPSLQQLPLTGPLLIGTREPRDEERQEALDAAVFAMVDRAERPIFWQPYTDSIPQVLERGRPLSVLFQHYPQWSAEVSHALESRQIDTRAAKFLPLVTRHGDWIVIVDAAGQPVYYVKAHDGAFF